MWIVGVRTRAAGKGGTGSVSHEFQVSGFCPGTQGLGSKVNPDPPPHSTLNLDNPTRATSLGWFAWR